MSGNTAYKRAAAFLLTICLGLVPCLAGADTAETVLPEDGLALPVDASGYGELVVGSTTALKGDFFTEMWGNATSDIDVRLLIHGYDLIRWNNDEGVFAVDDQTVVNEWIVQENAGGDRIYTFSLDSDLYYSDGTPITAYDYAFSFLLTMHPLMEALGAKPIRNAYIAGSEAYMSGESGVLSGVRVLAERILQITIRREYLPFYYELGLLECLPYPAHVLAPGCAVRDDGAGVYLEGDLSEELLRKTILDDETGYRSHPSVTCGPYRLVSFDGETASFEINPYFKGDDRGSVPTIPSIRYTLADNESMVAGLESGDYTLLNKITRADTAQAGLALVGTGAYSMTTYPRTGLTLIAFCGERPAVSREAVRQAIAHCLDKDAVVADYVGAYGLRIDGYYGMGQWMVQVLGGSQAYPGEEELPEELQARWEALQTARVEAAALDPDAAIALLEADGWVLNESGEPFRPGVDRVRCRQEGDALTALELTLAYPAGNRIVDTLEANFAPYLRQVGAQISFEPVETTELLEMFYRRTERTADMIYLGTDFEVLFDPAAHFLPDGEERLTWNYTLLADEALLEAALAMRGTQPGDIASYLGSWIDFQQRFSEVAPMLPIYSNVYFDLYPRTLHDYSITDNYSWARAVVSAYLGDAGDETELPEGETDASEEDEEFEFFD